MATGQQHITLHLGIHTVPMLVDKDKETLFRQAAVVLNETYSAYLAKFPKETAERMWMFVALDVAVALQVAEKAADLEEFETRVEQLNQRLVDLLEKEDIK